MKDPAAALGAALLIGLMGAPRAGVGQSAQLTYRPMKRLPPSAFAQLPRAVMRSLQARRCTIPQTWHEPKPHNVIRGAFIRPGQRDWAVLCSRHQRSSILIFWQGRADAISEIEPLPDRNFYQVTDNTQKMVYSRMIYAVSKREIERHDGYYKEAGLSAPPPLTHQGIEDAFLAKASTIHYRYRGKWLKFMGAD